MTKEQYLKNLQPPMKDFSVVLDTDAFNEVDDQYAIAYLLSHRDHIDLCGFTAAPFLNQRSTSPLDGMEKSYNEIKKVLTIAHHEDMIPKVYRGSDRYLPDEATPVVSDAAEFLVELSKKHSAEDPLYIVCIGAITNIASALLLDPEMKERAVVVWVGGHSRHIKDTKEFVKRQDFNMRQDYAAARVVFGCGVPLVQLPAGGVVDRFMTTQYELEHWLKGKNPLCDYLVERTVSDTEQSCPGQPWSRIIWDATGVIWLFNENDRFLFSRLVPSQLPDYDGCYSPVLEDHLIRYVDYVLRDLTFQELFYRLANFFH